MKNRGLMRIIEATRAVEMTKGEIWRGECPACGTETLEIKMQFIDKNYSWWCWNELIEQEDRQEHDKFVSKKLRGALGLLRDDSRGFCPEPVTELEMAEYSFFVATKERVTSTRTIVNGDAKIELIPSSLGHPTVFDEPIYLAACRVAIDQAEARGGEIPEWVNLNTLDFLVWNGGKDTEVTGARVGQIENSLTRIRGLEIRSTLRTKSGKEIKGTGLISDFKFSSHTSSISLKLANWTREAIGSRRYLSLPHDYLYLGAREKNVYKTLRKHIGDQREDFRIGIAKLREKTGFVGSDRKFRHFLSDKKKMDWSGTPKILDVFYILENNNVNVKPRKI